MMNTEMTEIATDSLICVDGLVSELEHAKGLCELLIRATHDKPTQEGLAALLASIERIDEVTAVYIEGYV